VFNELIQQIITVLRYIVSPTVGFTVALFLAEDQYKLIQAIAKATWPWNQPPSPWLIVGFLAVIGITVYYAYQTLFHPLVTKCLVKYHTRTLKPKPSINDLAYARWERRGAADHTNERSAQYQLDETNAAGHFFYCSAWSSLLFVLVLKTKFPNEYQPAGASWVVFGVLVAFLFFTALVVDNRTTKLDIEAYHRYKKH
jgi:hypothetical protein